MKWGHKGTLKSRMIKLGLSERELNGAAWRAARETPEGEAAYQRCVRNHILEHYPVGTPVIVSGRRGWHRVKDHAPEADAQQDRLKIMDAKSGFTTFIPLSEVKVKWSDIL